MAEVHFIGSLLGASKFPNSSLTCKYKIVTNSPEDWKLLEGKEYGQTHIDTPFVICYMYIINMIRRGTQSGTNR